MALPIRTAPRFCLEVCGRFDKSLYGWQDLSLSICRALGLFLTHKQCDVETGQMSSAETGQMFAVETGQMSAAETRPCLNKRRLSCLNSRHLSCLSSRHLSCLSRRHLSCLSRRHLSCLNNTLFVCQKQAKGPSHVIATDLDNRTITFQSDHTPQDRKAVRFEWALPFAVWRATETPKKIKWQWGQYVM